MISHLSRMPSGGKVSLHLHHSRGLNGMEGKILVGQILVIGILMSLKSYTLVFGKETSQQGTPTQAKHHPAQVE